MGVKKNGGKKKNSYQLPELPVTVTVTVVVISTIIIIPTNNILVNKKIIKKVDKIVVKNWG